jgi:hypothetical protein
MSFRYSKSGCKACEVFLEEEGREREREREEAE